MGWGGRFIYLKVYDEGPTRRDPELVRATADQGLKSGPQPEAPVGRQKLHTRVHPAVEEGLTPARALNEKPSERLEERVDVRRHPQVQLQKRHQGEVGEGGLPTARAVDEQREVDARLDQRRDHEAEPCIDPEEDRRGAVLGRL